MHCGFTGLMLDHLQPIPNADCLPSRVVKLVRVFCWKFVADRLLLFGCSFKLHLSTMDAAVRV